MRIYYVDPFDTSAITPAANTAPWIEGQTYDVPTHGKRAVKHEPPNDLYAEDDQRSDPPGSRNYYVTTDILEFVNGPPQINDAARVQATSNHQPISVEELYARKEAELNQLYELVRAQGVAVTLPSNGQWDIRSTGDAVMTYFAAHIDATLPGTTVTHDEDVWHQDFQWQKNDVPAMATQLWLLFAGANGVRNDHRDDMRALRDASVTPGDQAWLDLSVYDVSVGWPAGPTPPVGQSAPDIGTRNTVPIGLLQYVVTNSKTEPGNEDPAWAMRFLQKNRDAFDNPAELTDRWQQAQALNGNRGR